MKSIVKKILSVLLLIAMLAPLSVGVSAEEKKEAKDISGVHLVTGYTGYSSIDQLFNHKVWEKGWSRQKATITLEYDDGMGSLYLQFLKAYGPYSIIDNTTGAVFEAGTNYFIHEFVDLVECFGHAPTSVTISFQTGQAQLHELNVYTEGEVPSTVQKWEVSEDGMIDLLLFATHSDDDQLFFAGLLPYYAIEREYEVHVAYFTNHYNSSPHRVHEVLNGLWAAGVTNYPSFAGCEDFKYKDTLDQAFLELKKYGHTRESITGFIVEQLRRYKPIVAVGHDPEGEYGHIQHILYSMLLRDAVELSNNPEAYPESAEQYGLWDVPKTYLHLYEENQIVMDWDIPMENYGGMTPFEVSRDLGFAAHTSQQDGWGWYFEDKETAAQVTLHSPRHTLHVPEGIQF